MSGIEVAGLALGAFPLIISALHGVKECSKVGKQWRKIRKEHKKWTTELRVQEIFLRLTLEKLLLPLVPENTSHTLDDLLNDPAGSLWNEPSLVKKLKERLRFTFDQYVQVIEALKEALEELGTQLGMNKEHFQNILHEKVTIDERRTRILARIEFEYVRLKISTSSAERNETLKRVERYNEQLSKLLQGCDEVSAMEKSQLARKGNGRLDPKLTDFYRHADQLYTMLSKAWRCTCKNQHSIQLQLQHRRTAEYNFTVFFIFGQSIPAPNPQWTWRETKIMMIEQATSRQNLQTASGLLLGPAPAVTTASSVVPKESSASGFRIRGSAKRRKVEIDPQTPTNAMASAPKKRVGFADPPGNSASVRALSSPPVSQSGLRPPIDDEITNLCSFMASSTLTYFGVLRHHHEEYSVYPALTPQAATDPRDTVTLRSLLDKSLGISLSRKQRFFIGLTLASSYLQLHSTQWLKSQWDKSDILFPRHGSTVAVEEPFVSRGLSTGVLDGSMPANSHGIVSLGIMLLELAFNMTLEEFDRDREYVSPEGKRDAQLTWLAAVNWSKSAAEDAGIDFADAVKWCLQGQLVAVHDKEWRKELVANVLEPLQRFYGVFERIAKQ
ncbi:hypothetical protein SLS58_003242 [Diplodia intermedia]|uniref:DUF7580 domain-containing protein n=1 Tax=Diplodia intermedia TaxID=856260 RepID=A0ABR3TX93_9PEZI